MSSDPTFKMLVGDVFYSRRHGTAVTGRIESGMVTVGDTVELISPNGTRTTNVTKVEMFGTSVKQASFGDSVGLYLQDIGKKDVKRGDVLASKTNNIKKSSVKSYPQHDKNVEDLIGQFASPQKRQQAAEALLNIGGSQVAEALVQQLYLDPTGQFGLDVVATLVRLGDVSVEPLYKLIFEHKIHGTSIHDVKLYDRVGLALSKIGKAAVEPLLQLLKVENNNKIQKFILKVFCGIGDPILFDPLLQLLKDTKSKSYVKYIAMALGSIGDARAIDPIIEAMKCLKWYELGSEDGQTSFQNAFILMGEPAIAPLSAELNSENRVVRYIAKNAVKKIQKNLQKGIEPKLVYFS